MEKSNLQKFHYWVVRVKNWTHDSLILVGLLTIFLFCGGARLFGYYFDFGLIPVELTQVAKK